jgi:hypothetical protein
VRNVRKPNVLILLTVGLCGLILSNLCWPWTVIPWLIGLSIWGWYFRPERVPELQLLSKPAPFSFGLLALVLVASAAVRSCRLAEFPLGANVDEIFTLNDSLLLLEKPFNAVGQMPLISEGWVEIPNLYLYFNVLILKVVGVSYWSMKLFLVIPGVLATLGFS